MGDITHIEIQAAIKQLKYDGKLSTDADLAEKLGLDKSTVSTYISGKKKASKNFIEKFESTFQLSLNDFRSDYGKTYQQTRFDLKNNRKFEPIPIYDVDIAASNLELYNDKTETPHDWYYIPEFSGCRAFNVYSDSMEPLISKGSKIFARKLDDWQDHLEYGQVYSIGMTDGRRYLKYIKKGKTSDSFLLRSANDHYDDFEIRVSKIRSIWLVDGWMNKNTQSTFFVLNLKK